MIFMSTAKLPMVKTQAKKFARPRFDEGILSSR